MNVSTRLCSWRASSAIVALGALLGWIMLGSCPPAAADVRARFVNGRELVAREHWYVGSQVFFSHRQGAVGVPRTFVTAIEPLKSEGKIGGAPEAVNATPLVAPTTIR